jgi:hypothetical protein
MRFNQLFLVICNQTISTLNDLLATSSWWYSWIWFRFLIFNCASFIVWLGFLHCSISRWVWVYFYIGLSLNSLVSRDLLLQWNRHILLILKNGNILRRKLFLLIWWACLLLVGNVLVVLRTIALVQVIHIHLVETRWAIQLLLLMRQRSIFGKESRENCVWLFMCNYFINILIRYFFLI